MSSMARPRVPGSSIPIFTASAVGRRLSAAGSAFQFTFIVAAMSGGGREVETFVLSFGVRKAPRGGLQP